MYVPTLNYDLHSMISDTVIKLCKRYKGKEEIELVTQPINVQYLQLIT